MSKLKDYEKYAIATENKIKTECAKCCSKEMCYQEGNHGTLDKSWCKKYKCY